MLNIYKHTSALFMIDVESFLDHFSKQGNTHNLANESAQTNLQHTVQDKHNRKGSAWPVPQPPNRRPASRV